MLIFWTSKSDMPVVWKHWEPPPPAPTVCNNSKMYHQIFFKCRVSLPFSLFVSKEASSIQNGSISCVLRWKKLSGEIIVVNPRIHCTSPFHIPDYLSSVTLQCYGFWQQVAALSSLVLWEKTCSVYPSLPFLPPIWTALHSSGSMCSCGCFTETKLCWRLLHSKHTFELSFLLFQGQLGICVPPKLFFNSDTWNFVLFSKIWG